MEYQKRDGEIVDYQAYSLPNIPDLTFRGPKPESLAEGQYFVCIGAAQTLGCFCEKPYPALLQEKLNLPCLNLGMAGAGPSLFLENNQLLEYINQAKFAIVQVMSGRSESNSLFDSRGREYLVRRSDGVRLGADAAYQELLEKKDKHYVKDLIAETRNNWIVNYKKLLQKIEVSKILFWFSTREPFYIEKYTNVSNLFGRYPQLVNLKMIEKIKKYSNGYVECISGRGMPQLMISRFTYKPINIDLMREDLRRLYGNKQLYNKYYPSPEMQIDAANTLEKYCKKYLNNTIK